MDADKEINLLDRVNQLLLAADYLERREKLTTIQYRFKSDPSIIFDSAQTMINEKDLSETVTSNDIIEKPVFPVPEFTKDFTIEDYKHLTHLYWNIPARGPFICQVSGCEKEFNRKDNLKCHIKTHIPNRNRPFECYQCDRGYLRQVDLMRHIETVHLGVRRHFCRNCSKAFTRKEGLRIHAERCIAPNNSPVSLSL